MKIGIYGGTFDPMHNGHLNVIEKAFSIVNLILIVVNNQSPFKNRPMLSNAERLIMINEKVKGNKDILVDCSQMIKDEKSYTIDYINAIYDFENDFYYILGSDALLEFDKYKDWRDILKKVDLIVVEREGYDSNIFIEKYPEHLNKINIFKEDLHNISSTKIREKLKG